MPIVMAKTAHESIITFMSLAVETGLNESFRAFDFDDLMRRPTMFFASEKTLLSNQ